MKNLLILLIILSQTGFVNGQPVKKITVAQDGTGDYKTVQEAFDAVPLNNKTPVEIMIKAGIYKEKLHLDSSKNHVTIFGSMFYDVILTYDDHAGTVAPDGTTINTMTSQSFYVAADDFKAVYITFQNTAGLTAGQAVALKVQGDRAFFVSCRIIGFQDSLFTSGENSRQYYKACFIQGSTDFIFGPSTALFDDCTIRSKKNSHITAASTPKEHQYGYVFRRCKLVADSGLNKVSLGRPWRPYASVTYIKCTIGGHISPSGWDNWKNSENEKTVRYAEYKNTGPGSETSGRVPWSHQLTDKEVKAYTMKNILRKWQPYGNLYRKPKNGEIE